ncbi:MAG: hypothetical protein IKW45_05410 [Clostridia bacterium]|nr:hypothetical protein [Clostridia bacterium]
MAELIDRTEIFFAEKPKGNKDYVEGFMDGAIAVLNKIDEMPTVEEKTVVHAYWNDDGRCTNCGEHAAWIPFCEDWYESKYCHGCGAQMDEEVEDG